MLCSFFSPEKEELLNMPASALLVGTWAEDDIYCNNLPPPPLSPSPSCSHVSWLPQSQLSLSSPRVERFNLFQT